MPEPTDPIANQANAPDSGESPAESAEEAPVHRSLIRRYFDWLLVCVGVNPGYKPWEADSHPPARKSRK
jgi:hypothetical protein